VQRVQRVQLAQLALQARPVLMALMVPRALTVQMALMVAKSCTAPQHQPLKVLTETYTYAPQPGSYTGRKPVAYGQPAPACKDQPEPMAQTAQMVQMET
jgi:hypothetical protein